MSLVGARAWGMAAEHNRPALLGNARAAAQSSLWSVDSAPDAGRRQAWFLWSCELRRLHRMSPSRHKGFSVLHVRKSRGCPGWMVVFAPTLRIGERQHESQQHLPQQRAGLLADGASSAGRARQALLAHVSAILAAPRRARGARGRRIGKAGTSSQLGHALTAAA